MSAQGQAFRPIGRRIFHVKPCSASRTIRNRVVGKKKQHGTGPYRKQIVTARHRILYAVYLPGPACCGSGTSALRYATGSYTVCWILGGGRPGGGWKIVAGQCCGQYAPPKIARIFRVAPFSPQSRPAEPPSPTFSPLSSPQKPLYIKGVSPKVS